MVSISKSSWLQGSKSEKSKRNPGILRPNVDDAVKPAACGGLQGPIKDPGSF